jgi:DUF4097 and DUF4098 domain-containing protein YvlB
VPEDIMLRTCGFLTLFLAISFATAAAQSRAFEGNTCEGVSSDREYHCEMREDTLAGGNPLRIDASPNGGIRVRGWDRNEVAIRSRVVAYADSEQDARRLASQVRIETAGGEVRAQGPDRHNDSYFVVSFELNVPQNANLTLKTINGGISVGDLRGTINFDAVNGGVRLENVGGEVRGETNNGGLTIDLTGDRWDGVGLDVETHNGGVRLNLPENYSAELETGTTNGGLNVDFPITVQGRIGKHLHTTLGAGGPKIRAMTYNGGVSIRRQ